jgi:hypothetical protein
MIIKKIRDDVMVTKEIMAYIWQDYQNLSEEENKRCSEHLERIGREKRLSTEKRLLPMV